MRFGFQKQKVKKAKLFLNGKKIMQNLTTKRRRNINMFIEFSDNMVENEGKKRWVMSQSKEVMEDSEERHEFYESVQEIFVGG